MTINPPAKDGSLTNSQERQTVTAMAEPGSRFKPTELDLALARDPVTKAAHRELLAASQKAAALKTCTEGKKHQPAPPEQPNREGQREAAAASLAGGMIAAEGHPVTTVAAVEKAHEVMDELKRRE